MLYGPDCLTVMVGPFLGADLRKCYTQGMTAPDRYAPYVIPDGTNYAVAIREMVRLRHPDVGFDFKPPTRLTTPSLHYLDLDDPWTEAGQLALAVGYRLKFRRGRVRAFIPLGQWLVNLRFRCVTRPLWNVRQWVRDKVNPPVEYPDPDYSD